MMKANQYGDGYAGDGSRDTSRSRSPPLSKERNSRGGLYASGGTLPTVTEAPTTQPNNVLHTT